MGCFDILRVDLYGYDQCLHKVWARSEIPEYGFEPPEDGE